MTDDRTVQYLFRRKSLINNQSYDPQEDKLITTTNNEHNFELNYHEERYHQWEEDPFNGVKKKSIILYKKKRNRYKKRRKYKVYQYNKEQISFLIRSLDYDASKQDSRLSKSHSMPELKPHILESFPYLKKVKSTDILLQKAYSRLNTDFIVNTCCRTCDVPECLNPFINPLVHARIYRCQLNTQEESCCCSCNSDAMFEVMKSLYDCYKKKNCDHCDCILCGHLPKEERRLGEKRKSGLAEAGVETAKEKELKNMKMAEAKAQGLLTPLTGKTPEQKEKILRGLSKLGLPLPEGKTESEKNIIGKVRTELGLPQEPKTAAEKEKHRKAMAAGVLTPLEGKTKAQKENILRKQHELGIELPEGRTASEKSLIKRIKASGAPGEKEIKMPSEKIRKAKAAGFLTPLEGKTPEQKEKILRGLAKSGMPLPEGKTASEKKLIQKVRTEMGLPEPKTASEKRRMTKALAAGIVTPLEGKTPAQKEKILKAMQAAGVPLPVGRTASEKALIAKVKAEGPPKEIKMPSEKIRKATAAGFMTPLEGKTPAQKEKILRGLAKSGMPLPEGKTASEKKLIQKVRTEMGLPEPKTPSEKQRMTKALAAGIVTPLEGKTPAQKEKILKAMQAAGVPLPVGRTASEKALIAKVKAEGPPKEIKMPSEKIRKAKAAGLLTPLEGKTPEQKEKILRGLAKSGMALPEGKTPSEKKLIQKVRTEMGLPEPRTASEKQRMTKALAAGIVTPLEGKTPAQKEKILRAMQAAGVPLPVGRTASEKALIAKVKAEGPPEEIRMPSEKLRKAKAAGLLTPLAGKTPEQKEKILRGLAKMGMPLPEGKTASEKKLIQKVREEMGLPEPKTASEKQRMTKALAAGIVTPLEGKTSAQKEKILRAMQAAGIPLPVGRTASEKALIAKVKAEGPPKEIKMPSEKIRKATAAGFMTPLEGKTPAQKEKILRGLAKMGMPLPEGKTPSEKKLIQKVRAEMGLPEPKTASEKRRTEKALAAVIVVPLEGKTPAQKEKILRDMQAAGVPLPVGRTPSEKALIAKVKGPPALPPDQRRILDEKTAKVMKEGKGPSDECICGLLTPESERGPAPGRIPSEKAQIAKRKASTPSVRMPSERIRKAKAAGFLTPLEGKTPEQKEKILRGLAKSGMPLPEGKTPSEKKLIQKVRTEMGLPEPKTPSQKQRMTKALAAGIVTPLEGKTPAQKEKILKAMQAAGVPLPVGRTASEKALIAKVKAEGPPAEIRMPSEKIAKAKAAGFLTPLEGKTPEQKEKILRGLAKSGMPLPEGKTPSEKKLIQKVRTEMGLPEPKTASEKQRMTKALAAGIVTPLEGKTPAQKEKILRAIQAAGIPLPVGRTASEKALIAKVKAEGPPKEIKMPSEKIRKATAASFMTPLEGKTPAQKEKILRGLAKMGMPLPEGKTPSEKKLIQKVRAEMGLPEPKTASEKRRTEKALAAGIVVPLEGKTPAQKEKILRDMQAAGVPLPVGRTPSEKALIAKVKGPPALPPDQRRILDEKTAKVMKEGKGPSDECICGLLTPESERGPAPGRIPSEKAQIAKRKASTPSVRMPSERIRKAKAAGFLTPLEGKTPEQKEKILRGLAKSGMPLPEGKTPSEKKLIQKVRTEMGLPEPKTPSQKQRMTKALAAGIVTPLEGKTPAQKEKILKAMQAAGVPLPVGRTASEKALIAKVKAEGPPAEIRMPSEKIAKAKAAGLLTPLEGKTPEQKEKILRGLAKSGMPLPEGKTPSEKKLIQKVRTEMGLPEPKTPSQKQRMTKALAAGIVTPLEGKTPAQKEKILRAMQAAGVPLPVGRTPSEKALIAKVKAEGPPAEIRMPSEKIAKAKAAGFLTPLEGKTPEQKEKILRGLAKSGMPLPEGKTPSEKKLIQKVRTEMGLPEPKTPSEKQRMTKALAAGIVTPLEGKTPAQKEKILKAMQAAGVPLPVGRTASEKALIAKVKAEGSPKEIKMPSEKIRKATAAGFMTPLEGKTPAQKEKILRGLAKSGMPLPEGKTPSEKKLIQKVRTEIGSPEPKTPSEKRRMTKALAAGIVTPLEGKTPAQKEKILRAMQAAGVPLPVGRTASEKALIAKLDNEKADKLRKAKADGLLTPLDGKTPAQKEKIIRGLAKLGLPMPEGKTPSEKSLIRKVLTEMGIPPEAKTPSEKGKIKTKAKGVGEAAAKSAEIGVGAKAGITEELQDVLKTTTCDRACGCDKKKIRFKHSYVKIRVTSPDVSSLCPCPNECIPGVKGGVFVDNEGIKVTVGRALVVTSFTQRSKCNLIHLESSYSSVQQKSTSLFSTTSDVYGSDIKTSVSQNMCNLLEKQNTSNEIEYYLQYRSESHKTDSDASIIEKNEKEYCLIHSNDNNKQIDNKGVSVSDIYFTNESYYKSYETFRTDVSLSLLSRFDPYSAIPSSESSYDSILIVRTESSLSLISKSSVSFGTISMISMEESSVLSQSSNDSREFEHRHVNDIVQDGEKITKELYFSTAADALGSDTSCSSINQCCSTEYFERPSTISVRKDVTLNEDILIYRVSESKKTNKVVDYKYSDSSCVKETALNIKGGNNDESVTICEASERKTNKAVQYGNNVVNNEQFENIVFIAAINSKNNTSNENVVIFKVSNKKRKYVNKQQMYKEPVKPKYVKSITDSNGAHTLCENVEICDSYIKPKKTNNVETVNKIKSQNVKKYDDIVLNTSENKKKENKDVNINKSSNRQQNKSFVIVNENSKPITSNVLKMVNDLFARPVALGSEDDPVASGSSSVFVLVPSDSAESNNSLDDLGSTIGILLSDEFSDLNNNNNTPEVYRMIDVNKIKNEQLYPISRGLKISKKGKKKINLSNIDDTTDTLIEKEYLEKHCRILEPGREPEKAYHIVSTDTTVDRPCCCQPLHPQDVGGDEKTGSIDQLIKNACSKTLIVMQHDLKGASEDFFSKRSDRTIHIQLAQSQKKKESPLPICTSKEMLRLSNTAQQPECNLDMIKELKHKIERYKAANDALQKHLQAHKQVKKPPPLPCCASATCNTSHFVQSTNSQHSVKPNFGTSPLKTKKLQQPPNTGVLKKKESPLPICTSKEMLRLSNTTQQPECNLDMIKELKHKIERYKAANDAFQKHLQAHKQVKKPPPLPCCASATCNTSHFVQSTNSQHSVKPNFGTSPLKTKKLQQPPNTPHTAQKPKCESDYASDNLKDLKNKIEQYISTHDDQQKQASAKAQQKRVPQNYMNRSEFCTTPPKCSKYDCQKSNSRHSSQIIIQQQQMPKQLDPNNISGQSNIPPSYSGPYGKVPTLPNGPPLGPPSQDSTKQKQVLQGDNARVKSPSKQSKKSKKEDKASKKKNFECQCHGPSKSKKSKKSKGKKSKKGKGSEEDSEVKVARVAPPLPSPSPEPSVEFMEDYSYEQLLKDAKNDEFAQIREMNKMKSDLTLTRSGFKVSKKPLLTTPTATPPEDKLSYEQIIELYGDDKPIDDTGHKTCTCEEKSVALVESTCPNPNINCECPPPPPPPAPDAPLDDSPFGKGQGLKFTIGGKGTGSKGLSGICCFDLTQQELSDTKVSSDTSVSSSNTEYLLLYK